MSKIVILALTYLCTWIVAACLGMLCYRSDARGGVRIRPYVDRFALVMILAGFVVIAYLTARLAYGELVIVTSRCTGYSGRQFYLNEAMALAEVMGLSAIWTAVACQCYRLGAARGSYCVIQPLSAPVVHQTGHATESCTAITDSVGGQSQSPEIGTDSCSGLGQLHPCATSDHTLTGIGEDGKLYAVDASQVITECDDDSSDEVPTVAQHHRICDLRLSKSFPDQWMLGDLKYRRSHKDPDAPEVHFDYHVESAEITDGIISEGYLMTIETNELAYPHIWAREIAQAMRSAGWTQSLSRISECEEIRFADPDSFCLGYAASLDATTQDESADLDICDESVDSDTDYVSKLIDNIVSAIQDEGIKLRRDPLVHEAWQSAKRKS